jgi:glutamyl-tRNA synthetase
VPMIHGTDGKKLSKRHGAMAVGEYAQLGILPGALRNFLALLGWNPGDDRELYFEVHEMIAAFSIDGLQKKAAIFDPAKLEWMNGQYIQRSDPAALLELIRGNLTATGLDLATIGSERLRQAIAAGRERAHTTLELAQRTAVRFDAKRIEREDKADTLIAKDPAAFRAALDAVLARLDGVPAADWTAERIETDLRALAEERGEKPGAVFQPVRVALTGATVSEPVNVLLVIVGRNESLARLRAARGWTA